ncbi:hypothetical protein PX699_07115 [Sphingobium sp. H39-3-25]|uniref:hypothetical protein n=1 Tax=Sphingobium arseniciresistens TaxID=3030834 RepID=UPI0023B8FCA8|nr:hypothetical protein [Sphingobium arseniciresistens]
MLDPFTFYSRMVAAAFEMVGTAQRASETLSASQEVIAKRSAMMGVAARTPLEGDYAELSRMVPEKIEAFAKAGTVMANDWWAIQSAFITEAQRMGGMAMKGRAPTLTELQKLSSRQSRFALRMLERTSAMGDRGLRPIHASATANARRLKHKAV